MGYEQAARLPVLVGVSGYSRWILARMIASTQTHDVLGGHRWYLSELGRVPRVGVYDGEPAISSRRGGHRPQPLGAPTARRRHPPTQYDRPEAPRMGLRGHGRLHGIPSKRRLESSGSHRLADR